MKFSFDFFKGTGNNSRRRERTIVQYDYSDLNHLPAEIKVLVVNAQAALQAGETIMNDTRYYLDLTSKKQLKTDMKCVEKNIDAVTGKKMTKKTVKELENSIIRLNTVIKGLKQFFG